MHRLKHFLGLNTGTVESFYIGEVLWTGFKCSKCGRINEALPIDYRFSYKLSNPKDNE